MKKAFESSKIFVQDLHTNLSKKILPKNFSLSKHINDPGNSITVTFFSPKNDFSGHVLLTYSHYPPSFELASIEFGVKCFCALDRQNGYFLTKICYTFNEFIDLFNTCSKYLELFSESDLDEEGFLPFKNC